MTLNKKMPKFFLIIYIVVSN